MKKLTEMILDRVTKEKEKYAVELEKEKRYEGAKAVREGVIFLQNDGMLYFRWKEDSNYPINHEEDHYHEMPGFYRGGNGQGRFGELIEEPTIAELELIINFVSSYNVLTFPEAQEKWGLGTSTLRKAVMDNRFEEGEIRKSGSNWLVTYEAMERLYGKLKEGNND